MGSCGIGLVAVAAFGIIRGSGAATGPELAPWQWINLVGAPLVAAGFLLRGGNDIAAWYRLKSERPDRAARSR